MDQRYLIEQAMQQISERQRQASAVTEKIQNIRGKAQSEDERICVEVGAMGQLESLQLDPRALRMPSEDLAETIVELARTATEDAADQTRREMETLLGQGVDWQKLVDDAGNLDMNTFNRAAESLGMAPVSGLPERPTFGSSGS